MRYIIPISGKDSLCTAIVQRKDKPNLPYEYLFNPTGSELPEVFEWLKRVEEYLGQEIVRVGKSLEGIIKSHNYFLPSRMSRYCTRQSKIEPMIEFIGDDEADVFYGIRADEERAGFNPAFSPNINPVYPLKQHGIGINEVYQIINEHGLKPPAFYWKWLHDEVTKKLGFDPAEIMPEYIFDPMFAWRTRANCYYCFNQRQYEIVGLWEHHPELAEKALWYETQGTSENGYTWREYPFDWYRDNAEKIKQARVKKIIKIVNLSQQLSLFNADEVISEDGFFDLFKVSSCGLLCGK